MRDLDQLFPRLQDALSPFETFEVARFQSDKSWDTRWADVITITRITKDERELTIAPAWVNLYDPNDDAVGMDIEGEWFAVVSIVFAILSGRE